MENYTVAELEIIAVAAKDTISASIEIELDENELPIDKYANL